MIEFGPDPISPKSEEEPLSPEERAELYENALLAREVKAEFETTIGMTVDEAEDEATKFLRQHGFDENGQGQL